jgi:hypothetical protein
MCYLWHKLDTEHVTREHSLQLAWWYELAVKPRKQVAERAPTKGIPPAPTTMFGRVVDHMTALTKRCEVAPASSAEGGIVVQVSRRQIDGLARYPNAIKRDEQRRATELATPAIAPRQDFRIPPYTGHLDELRNVTTVGTTAMFASSGRPREAYDTADLRPIDRIEPAVFGTDWHGCDSESCRTRTKGENRYR